MTVRKAKIQKSIQSNRQQNKKYKLFVVHVRLNKPEQFQIRINSLIKIQMPKHQHFKMATGPFTSFDQSYFVQVTITVHLKLFSEQKLRRQYHRKTSQIQIVLTLIRNVRFLDRFQFYVKKYNIYKKIFLKRFKVLILN